ncbi:MAG: DUF481 domain-containing protein [Candidatus Saganbacteria bacterium]|nr:DUF481 domain-containing protein [Candidatus Saganbacteria bacterium]
MLRYIIIFAFIVTSVTASNAELIFQRKLSFGSKITGGNSEFQSIDVDWLLDRNDKNKNQLTFSGAFDRESSNGVDSVFRVNGTLRYAHSLTKQYFNYCKLDATHDRSQDIDVRLVPTLGFGFWFVDEANFKFNIEGALGYQLEYLRDQTQADTPIWSANSTWVLGDFTNTFALYSALTDFGNFRAINTASYSAKINNNFFVKLTLKDEYNNRPVAGVLKNDITLTTSLQYAIKEKGGKS